MIKSVQEHNKAALESMMTPEEALAWARRYYAVHAKWPVRRFRLEKAPLGGTSRLVTKSHAEALQGRCGGLIVEVIPSKEEVVHSLLVSWAAEGAQNGGG